MGEVDTGPEDGVGTDPAERLDHGILEDHAARPHLQVRPEARSAGHIAGNAIALGPAFLEARRPRGVHLVRTDGDQQVIALRRDTSFQGITDERRVGHARVSKGRARWWTFT